MRTQQQPIVLTGEEFGRRRRALIERAVPEDSPEFHELYDQVDARDDYLFEKHGKLYRDSHPGKWIAISLDGEVIIRNTSGELICAAADAFGEGSFSMRRLADFPGYQLLS